MTRIAFLINNHRVWFAQYSIEIKLTTCMMAQWALQSTWQHPKNVSGRISTICFFGSLGAEGPWLPTTPDRSRLSTLHRRHSSSGLALESADLWSDTHLWLSFDERICFNGHGSAPQNRTSSHTVVDLRLVVLLTFERQPNPVFRPTIILLSRRISTAWRRSRYR